MYIPERPERNSKKDFNRMKDIEEEVCLDLAAYEDVTHPGIRNGLNKFEKIKKKNKVELKRGE